MQRYSRDIVAEVLAAVDIVDVVRNRLELKPAGSGRLKALCPFHREKTPSFTVNRDRQIYHCFGCGKGGDALSFIQEYDGLTFVEALRQLADQAGIRLPASSGQDSPAQYMRQRLSEFLDFASAHFREELAHPVRGKTASRYLESRQLKHDTIERFGLGYAPDAWSSLLDAAGKKRFEAKVVEASGLFKRGQRGNLYDFFRNRLMFPIKDVAGKVVAFGGRDLGDSPAKYINSPETAVYKKSRVLYGLHEAREALRHEKRAILVEGYFDLLRCFDAGIENVVASCGTALTADQAALIRRYVSEVVIVYDGDPAGVQAALRGTAPLTAAGLTVRATVLPENRDPDDFIKESGPQAFLDKVEQADGFVSFYARMSHDRTGNIEGRTQVAHEIFALIEQMDDELRVDEYVKRVAHELGLNEWACRNEYARFRRKTQARPKRAPKPTTESAPVAVNRDDRDFVAVLLADEKLRRQAQRELAEVPLEPGPLTAVLERLFQGDTARLVHDLEDEAARQLYTAAAGTDTQVPDPGELVTRRVARLAKEALRTQAARLHEELMDAERRQDMARVTELFGRKIQLQQEMEKAGAT